MRYYVAMMLWTNGVLNRHMWLDSIMSIFFFLTFYMFTFWCPHHVASCLVFVSVSVLHKCDMIESLYKKDLHAWHID